MKRILFLVIIVLFYSTIPVIAQQLNYTSNKPTYSIDLRKTGSFDPTSQGGLFTYSGSTSTIYEIGKLATAPTYAHGVYQWNISDLEIPDGSTINSVTVSFNYSWVQTTVMTINLFNCNINIADQNLDISELWNTTDKDQSTPIGEGVPSLQGTQYYMRATFNNGSNFVTQFTNSINQNDRFTLGLAWKYESPEAGVTYWNFSPGGLYPSISVLYTPPQQSVNLDQRLSNNSQVGKLRKWEGSYFTPYPFINPGTPFNFNVGSTQTFKAISQSTQMKNIIDG